MPRPLGRRRAANLVRLFSRLRKNIGGAHLQADGKSNPIDEDSGKRNRRYSRNAESHLIPRCSERARRSMGALLPSRPGAPSQRPPFSSTSFVGRLSVGREAAQGDNVELTDSGLFLASAALCDWPPAPWGEGKLS